MKQDLREKLSFIAQTLREIESYQHACRVLNFDEETICPERAMGAQGEVRAFLSNKAFKLTKEARFIESSEALFIRKDELDDPLDRILAEDLHRSFLKTKNVTPAMDHEFSLVYNDAFVDWLNAKQKSDFAIFSPSLKKVRDVELKKISLRESKLPDAYDNLLDDYERGMTTRDLDAIFSTCRGRLVPILHKIQNSKKRIRTDFLTRSVTDEQQREMSKYLLETMGFDFRRGAFTVSEHPFTEGLGRDDVRVTTHYYPNMFCSSIYSIIHEGGHALFEMYQPGDDWDHFINNDKTMGMHESVSRFYENRVGRSKAFIHLIYPSVKKIFSEAMRDVSENELYEAVNVVTPSLVRIEADELTYTFHIIIRYELEKMMVNDHAEISSLPELWAEKYEEYLGIRPQNDTEGVLQDIHWTSGFGYFTTYALGNMYNAMYYKTMSEEFDVEAAIAKGNFARINGWMKDRVWKNANRLTPKEWLRDITGDDFSVEPFLDYLEKKYTEIYEL